MSKIKRKLEVHKDLVQYDIDNKICGVEWSIRDSIKHDRYLIDTREYRLSLNFNNGNPSIKCINVKNDYVDDRSISFELLKEINMRIANVIELYEKGTLEQEIMNI